MRYPGFIGPSGQLASVNVNAERTVNLYLERADGSAKNSYYLRPTPGLRAVATLPGGGPVRAVFSQDGRCWAVCGDRFVEVFADWSWIQRGIVNADTRRASIDINGAGELLIVSGMAGYIYNKDTHAFTTITDPGFPAAALWGLFADNYFLALASGSTRVAYSGLADGLAWDGLDVFAKSQTTDNLLAGIYDHKELWLFGSKTTEVWFNSGDPNDPWSPQPILIEGGIAAPDSVTKGDDSIFWLRGNEHGVRRVVRRSGYDAVPVSTHAVNTAIDSYSTVSDAIGWYYEADGHGFYVLTFPTAKATWVYDVTERTWHERGEWNATDGVYEAFLGRCHTFAWDKHIVGSRVDGTLYVMERDARTNDGTAIRRLRRAPHVANENKRIFHDRLELHLEVGVGVSGGGQGTDPQIFLRYSNDGGYTWSSERWASLGPFEQFKRRVFWNRLGMSRNRVYEVVVTDPVLVAITDAYIELTGGLH